MHPYRDCPLENIIPGKKRALTKTLYWKLLLWIKGSWKQRYYRGCGHPGCQKVHSQMDGGLIDFQPFWCQIQHQNNKTTISDYVEGQ